MRNCCLQPSLNRPYFLFSDSPSPRFAERKLSSINILDCCNLSLSFSSTYTYCKSKKKKSGENWVKWSNAICTKLKVVSDITGFNSSKQKALFSLFHIFFWFVLFVSTLLVLLPGSLLLLLNAVWCFSLSALTISKLLSRETICFFINNNW